jgi:hypothetical protein
MSFLPRGVVLVPIYRSWDGGEPRENIGLITERIWLTI